jgi:hypothetical protein
VHGEGGVGAGLTSEVALQSILLVSHVDRRHDPSPPIHHPVSKSNSSLSLNLEPELR